MQRVRYKAQLIQQIEQQRRELSAASHAWIETTTPFDRGWNRLKQLRNLWVIAASVIRLIHLIKPHTSALSTQQAVDQTSIKSHRISTLLLAFQLLHKIVTTPIN